MVQIMCLYWLQQTGNMPIALMGGGTTRVGDPSGKDETRKILSIEDIDANKEGIKQVFSRFLSFGDGKADAVVSKGVVSANNCGVPMRRPRSTPLTMLPH